MPTSPSPSEPHGIDRTSGGLLKRLHTGSEARRNKVRPIFRKLESDGAAAATEPGVTVLTLPGLDGSGPRHWQSHWERLSGFARVEFPDWARPRLHEWVPALDGAIRASARPVVLAAHSLGCLAAAWWAELTLKKGAALRVKGALLVAPPDVDALHVEPRLRDFRPMPRLRLPFPTLLVASRNDPHAGFDRSQEMAEAWGSRFVDAGAAGHINADSAIGEWSQGLRLLAGLTGHNPNLLVAELGLRTALA
jgi:predicted alpha/beta hydrolase family esterase